MDLYEFVPQGVVPLKEGWDNQKKKHSHPYIGGLVSCGTISKRFINLWSSYCTHIWKMLVSGTFKTHIPKQFKF